YCGCAHAEALAPQGACGLCPIRCPSRSDIAAWMADFGGTITFDGVRLGGRLPGEWPAFIPQVDGSSVGDLDERADWPAYAVGLRRVFSASSHRLYPRFVGRDVHDVLALKPGRMAVLVGYGLDPLV